MFADCLYAKQAITFYILFCELVRSYTALLMQFSVLWNKQIKKVTIEK